jgi:hypothetical protein
MVGIGVSRAVLQTHLQKLQTTISSGNVIAPQEMYDPNLVHPYPSSPPGGQRVLADAAFVQKKMDTDYAAAPTIPAAMALSSEVAAKHARNGNLAALGAAACAIGGAVGLFWLPAGHTIAQWLGGFGACAAGCVAAAVSESRKSAEETRFTELLHGWETNIQNPGPLIPIPQSDLVNWDYVKYTENMAIAARRRHIP